MLLISFNVCFFVTISFPFYTHRWSGFLHSIQDYCGFAQTNCYTEKFWIDDLCCSFHFIPFFLLVRVFELIIVKSWVRKLRERKREFMRASERNWGKNSSQYSLYCMNGILIDTYNALWYLGHVWIDLFELIDCHKLFLSVHPNSLTKLITVGKLK
jgi:hypothetical protein